MTHYLGSALLLRCRRPKSALVSLARLFRDDEANGLSIPAGLGLLENNSAPDRCCWLQRALAVLHLECIRLFFSRFFSRPQDVENPVR
jgi:hypothetical protein